MGSPSPPWKNQSGVPSSSLTFTGPIETSWFYARSDLSHVSEAPEVFFFGDLPPGCPPFPAARGGMVLSGVRGPVVSTLLFA